MKTLGIKTLVLLISLNISASYADDLVLTEVSFKQMIKLSPKLVRKCKSREGKLRKEGMEQFVDFIGEVEYRCLGVDKRSPAHSDCNLTLYRLKSDFLECSEQDYYLRKIQRYIQ